VEGASAAPQTRDFGRTVDDTGDVEDEKREPDDAQDRGSETQGGNIKNQSMMSAFRDFFLAAFSDSYSYQDVRRAVYTMSWVDHFQGNTFPSISPTAPSYPFLALWLLRDRHDLLHGSSRRQARCFA
jgi:hypothetical protein